jgi:ATP-dependent protease ClpP protease subunit
VARRRRFTALHRPATQDWCKIKAALNQDVDTTEVYIYDEIGYWGTRAGDFVNQLCEVSTPKIDLHLNSPGGEVFDGVAIAECLRAHPAAVTVYVDSLAASIATVIAMSGDKIIIGRSAQMMIHNASGMCWGTAAAMREEADLLDRLSGQIAQTYADRCGKPKSHWQAAMDAETWYFGSEAVDAGLADEIMPMKPRPGTEDDPDEDLLSARWDLSVFRYAGRAEAPPPVAAPVARLDLIPDAIRAAFRKDVR